MWGSLVGVLCLDEAVIARVERKLALGPVLLGEDDRYKCTIGHTDELTGAFG